MDGLEKRRQLIKDGLLEEHPPPEGLRDKMQIKGKLHIQLFDKDGKLKDERLLMNTVTALGDAHVADQLSDQGNTAMSHMAVGTGTPTGTALQTETDRNALTSTTQGTAGDDNDVIYVGTWAAGDGTGALTEAGIFNDASAGTMFVSSSFAAINKGAADTLVITWTVTFGAT